MLYSLSVESTPVLMALSPGTVKSPAMSTARPSLPVPVNAMVIPALTACPGKLLAIIASKLILLLFTASVGSMGSATFLIL